MRPRVEILRMIARAQDAHSIHFLNMSDTRDNPEPGDGLYRWRVAYWADSFRDIQWLKGLL